MITRAMIYRPKKIATRLGTFGEVLYAMAPKSVDVILNTAFKLFPESAAAKGEKARGREGLDRGRRVRAPDARRALVVAVAVGSRRRKHWGWGYEDEQPSPDEVRRGGGGHPGAPRVRRRRRRGAGAARATSSCRAPRLEPPAGACGDLLDGRLRPRVARLRQGLPRRRARLPRPLRPRARRGRVPARRGRGRGAARVVREPRRGGDPLRRRHERRRRRRGRRSATATRARSRSTSAGSTACSRSTAPRARRGSRPARPGPVLEDQLREHGLTLRHFPQSFELSTLGGWIATRAGGHFATLYTHIDDLVESIRAVTPAGAIETRRLPGSGAGPSPDRMLLGSEGTLGVITEAWVRVQDRPAHKASAAVTFADFARGRARRCGRWRRAACTRPTAGCSIRREAALTGRLERTGALLVLGFESADHPVEPWMDARARAGRRPRRRRSAGAGGGGGDGDSVGAWRDVVPARALPARHVRRVRRDQRDLRDGDHLGPVRGAAPRR